MKFGDTVLSSSEPRSYIRCTAGQERQPLPEYVEHARTAPNWRSYELAAGHWPMISTPRELADLLLAII